MGSVVVVERENWHADAQMERQVQDNLDIHTNRRLVLVLRQWWGNHGIATMSGEAKTACMHQFEQIC